MVDHGTRIEFFGGLGVIGGSKVCVSTHQARVVFDCGADLPRTPDLFRPPVRTRPGRSLHDAVAIGQTRWIPGVFDPAQRPASIPPHPHDNRDLHDNREIGLFVSHAHIDHDGLLGHIREDLVVHASPETIALHQALALAGRGPAGRPIAWQPVTAPITIGDLTVEFVPVDHDVPGAVAMLIDSPDGRIAYTGDINFHRDHGSRSYDFVTRARGVHVLLSETTSLSSEEELAIRSEEEILDIFIATLVRPGLQLVSLYERDLDRAQRWIRAAAENGRTIVWPGGPAAVLTAAGLTGVTTWDSSHPQALHHQQAHTDAVRAGLACRTVSLGEVAATPQSFVVQPDATDPAALVDLPLGARTAWVHSQGEPLGPFMPDWGPFTDWLAHLDIEIVEAGSSGHATPNDLRAMVETIAPAVLFGFHGFRPERLIGPGRTVSGDYGVQYRLDGTPE